MLISETIKELQSVLEAMGDLHVYMETETSLTSVNRYSLAYCEGGPENFKRENSICNKKLEALQICMRGIREATKVTVASEDYLKGCNAMLNTIESLIKGLLDESI